MQKKALLIGLVLSWGALFSQPVSAKSVCEDFESSLCFQIFAPVWCVSLSVGGEVVKKPLLAKGSNSCIAIESLKKKACDRGLDWRKLVDEEVHCVPVAK